MSTESDETTEWYVVVSLAGNVTDTREAASRALRYMADQVAVDGYGGGAVGFVGENGDDFEVEAHLVRGGQDPEMCLVELDEGDEGPAEDTDETISLPRLHPVLDDLDN